MPKKRKINALSAGQQSNKDVIKQNVKKKNAKIYEIVMEAQKNDSYHEKCVKQINKLYESSDHESFMNDVIRCLTAALCWDPENEFANGQLRFWAKALTSFDNNEDTHKTLKDTLNHLLNTMSSDSSIRYRICFFVNALLNAMGPEAQLDDNICNNVLSYMIERIRDTNQNVRLQAVHALQRLQNPDDNEDKVIQVYMFHIDNDPSPKVRQAVITAVAKTKKTIPYIIGRLWDVEDKVRRHTVLQMSKYPVKSYMVAQRLKILEQSLKDSSLLVKGAVSKVMLPQWIESYQRDYLNFLTGLKFDASEDELINFKQVSIDALQEIFKKEGSIMDAIKCLQINSDEPLEKCIPLSVLNVERVVLWYGISIFLRNNDDIDADEVLPDLVTMAKYIFQYVEENQSKNDPTADRFEKMYFQFVLETLLQIVNGYDFGDEVGRQEIKNTLFEILKTACLEESVIKAILQILEQILTNPDERLQQISELIRSISDFNQNFDLEAAKRVVNNYLEKNPNIDLETQIRQKALRILELKEQESSFMAQKNYSAAQALSICMENSIEEYKILIKPIIEQNDDDTTLNLAHSLYRKKRLSNDAVIKCLHIFFYTVTSRNVIHLIPSIVELYKKIICVHFESQETNARNWALRCSTSCAILYESLSKEVFDALWKQFVNTSSVKIWKTTIQCMFELLDPYGFDHFDLEKEQFKNKKGRQLFSMLQNEDDIDESENAGTFMSFMAQLIDNCDDSSIRSAIVHGYCRLILRGHLSSSEVVVKLLLTYFNPATENELSQSLGIFFEHLINSKKQELLQQALLPTINAILDAPLDSPLAEINTKKVVRFVLQSTRHSFCSPGLFIHDTITLSFLSTIKECDEDLNKELIRLITGELSSLEISEELSLKDGFMKLAEDLKKNFKDSKIVKNLNDFIIRLQYSNDSAPVSTLNTNIKITTESDAVDQHENTKNSIVETESYISQQNISLQVLHSNELEESSHRFGSNQNNNLSSDSEHCNRLNASDLSQSNEFIVNAAETIEKDHKKRLRKTLDENLTDSVAYSPVGALTRKLNLRSNSKQSDSFGSSVKTFDGSEKVTKLQNTQNFPVTKTQSKDIAKQKKISNSIEEKSPLKKGKSSGRKKNMSAIHGILPCSPQDIIGTRSLTSRNLRNRKK